MNDDTMIRLDEINLKILLRDLLLNIWVVVLIGISCMLALGAFERAAYRPQYTSTATLVVSEKGNGNAYTNLQMTKNMAEVFGEVFQSEVLKTIVAQESGTDRFEGQIGVELIPETNLLTLSVTADHPLDAFRSLGLILDNYSVVSDYLFGNAVLDVIKNPEVPLGPSNSFLDSRQKKLAGLAGAFLGACLVVVCSVLRGTVKTKAGARNALEGELLQTIGHEKKKKVGKGLKTSILMTDPLASFEFVDACQSLCSRIDHHMKKRGQKVLLISSASENEGKSTVASNVALGLAARKRRVILLDCDFRKPAVYKIFDIEKGSFEELGKYLLSMKEKQANNTLEPYRYTPVKNVKMGLNSNGYSSPQKFLSSKSFAEFIRMAREDADFVIIDSPPILLASDVEVLAGSVDTSILVVRQDNMYVRDINDCIDVLNNSRMEFMGYILNDYE